MGQWSQTFKVGKAQFVAHANTGDPFHQVTTSAIVDLVMLVDDGGDPEEAATTLGDLRAKMVGWTLSDLEMLYGEGSGLPIGILSRT